jgi:hypothetical protein
VPDLKDATAQLRIKLVAPAHIPQLSILFLCAKTAILREEHLNFPR